MRRPGVINDDIVELLARGEWVVLDASWLAEAERALAQELAKRTSSRLVALRCTAPTPVTEARLRTRTGTVSDADPTIAHAMTADAEPWPDAVTIDTSGIPTAALAEANRIIQAG